MAHKKKDEKTNDWLFHQAWFYFIISLVLFLWLLYWWNNEINKLNQRVNYCQSVQWTWAVSNNQVFEKRLENLEGKYIDVLASKDTINFWLVVLTVLLPVSLWFFVYQKGKFEEKAEQELDKVEKKMQEARVKINSLDKITNWKIKTIADKAKKETNIIVEEWQKQMHISILFNDALRFHDNKEYKKAIENYNKLIELEKWNKFALSVYYNNRWNVFCDLKKYEEAINDYTKAIDLDPQDDDAYYNRWITHAELENYDESIKDYTKAIENNPKKEEAYYNRWSSFYYLKRYEESIADYTKAIELLPENWDIFAKRSDIEKLRKMPEFQEFLKKHNI